METLLEQGSVLMEEEKIQEVESKREDINGSRDRGESLQKGGRFYRFSSEKNLLPVCPSLRGCPLWHAAQKPPFIYPEHLVL